MGLNTDKIESEILNLANSMALFGVSIDDAITELRDAYAEELENMARRAREAK